VQETSARRRKRDSITPDAVPRNPVKFEEGASIEAVDCGKWYAAKIVKVNYCTYFASEVAVV